MKFAVVRPYDEKLEKYGFKTQYFLKPNNFMEKVDECVFLSKLFAEIDINTIEELFSFMNKIDQDIVIRKTDDMYDEYSKKYPYEIMIYDDLIE